RLLQVQPSSLEQSKRSSAEQVEVRWKRTEGQVVEHREPRPLHGPQQHRPVVEGGMLRRLQSGPAIEEQAERDAVEPRDLDNQAALRRKARAGVRERAHRVVVVLEEV